MGYIYVLCLGGLTHFSNEVSSFGFSFLVQNFEEIYPGDTEAATKRCS